MHNNEYIPQHPQWFLDFGRKNQLQASGPDLPIKGAKQKQYSTISGRLYQLNFRLAGN